MPPSHIPSAGMHERSRLIDACPTSVLSPLIR